MQHYSEFIADQVLDLVADGWSLERIHKEIDGMPSRSAFLRWRRADPKLSTKYEKALQDRIALSFDKLSDIALKLLDPADDSFKGKATDVRAASEILLKLLGNTTALVGMTGVDEKNIAHIKVELVKAIEEKPAEAE